MASMDDFTGKMHAHEKRPLDQNDKLEKMFCAFEAQTELVSKLISSGVQRAYKQGENKTFKTPFGLMIIHEPEAHGFYACPACLAAGAEALRDLAGMVDDLAKQIPEG